MSLSDGRFWLDRDTGQVWDAQRESLGEVRRNTANWWEVLVEISPKLYEFLAAHQDELSE